MLTLIIGCLVGLILAYVLFLRHEVEIDDIFLTISMMVILFGFIGTMVSIMLPHKYYTYKDSEIEIMSLNDVHEISGNFVLGSGNIDGNFYYYFYYKTDDNFIKLDKINSKDTKIRYVSSNPSIEIYKWKSAKNFKNMFSFSFPSSIDDRYILNIPENTIVKDYKIDLR